ncbi:MAG: hypothetical protein AVDCRST_MAG90-3391 [uncultured Microvirga sp.]|uniref:DUF1640 domain-containing protein n=1 Tax=uncultured Microvirga sp. TaxID=412392 RepID=A0A6J4MSI5_9HYPH|nr:MAG: hypothetical protein AVDCRST_MAG90-3391 [uncultured Microvirga sp.]
MGRVDTLKLARRLEEHGLERKQAEGLALELEEAIAVALKDFATKDDLDRFATRVALETRANIAESRNTQMVWTITTVLVLAGLVVAGARLIG